MKKIPFLLATLLCTSCSTTRPPLDIQRGPSVDRTLKSFASTSAMPDRASFPIEEFVVSDSGKTSPVISGATTPSGLQVIFVPDATIPLVRASLMIPGGVLTDDPSNFGRVSAFGTLLRVGGAGANSPNELDEKLQKLSASITSGAGPETITVSFSCLTSDVETVFPLFTDVLLKPRFEVSRLSLWKSQAIDELRRRKDSPDTVAALSLKKLLFGDKNILSAIPTAASINSVDASALKGLAKSRIGKTVGNRNAVLVLSGDLKSEKARDLAVRLSRLLPGNVQAAPAPTHPIISADVPADSAPELVYVEQPLTQATVYMGIVGPERDPSKEASIDLFNTYFGKGGFGSVLMKRVRTELGLAYGVFGAVSQAPFANRAILVVQTKSTTTGDAAKAMFESLQDVQAGKIQLDSLEEARRAELNAYPFSFSSPQAIAARRAVQIIQNYPADFDVTYPQQLAAASADDVRQVSATYFPNARFKIVVVGNRAALESVKAKLNTFPPPFNSLKIREGIFTDQLQLN